MAALCVEALGKERVIGVLMPSGTQSDISDSRQLLEHNDTSLRSWLSTRQRRGSYEFGSSRAPVGLPRTWGVEDNECAFTYKEAYNSGNQTHSLSRNANTPNKNSFSGRSATSGITVRSLYFCAQKPAKKLYDSCHGKHISPTCRKQ